MLHTGFIPCLQLQGTMPEQAVIPVTVDERKRRIRPDDTPLEERRVSIDIHVPDEELIVSAGNEHVCRHFQIATEPVRRAGMR